MSSFSLTVAAPPQTVFDYLTDPRHRPEWQSSLRGVEVLTDGPVGVGTRWVDRTAVGARPVLEITEMRAPAGGEVGLWTEVGHWRGVRAELSLAFGAPAHVPGLTLVTGTVEIRTGAVWLPVRLALQALAGPAIRSDLRRAGRILEGGAPRAQ
jgi:hypothetical protein